MREDSTNKAATVVQNCAAFAQAAARVNLVYSDHQVVWGCNGRLASTIGGKIKCG
jgi:hypothetical protein